MRASGGTRAGRSHRARAVPCQDAFALLELGPERRVAAAVADGLGSRRLSHAGSDTACRAAVASLAREPTWDAAALARAFEAARTSLETVAADIDASLDDLATTLQVAMLADGSAVAGSLGDGAIVTCGSDVRILLDPEESEYANEVVPLTHPDWRAHLRTAEAGPTEALLLFTDGLTRLLLARKQGRWEPYGPFFDAFLPKVLATDFERDLVPQFLETPAVDESWDDDKCLVVIGHDGPRV